VVVGVCGGDGGVAVTYHVIVVGVSGDMCGVDVVDGGVVVVCGCGCVDGVVGVVVSCIYVVIVDIGGCGG